MNLNKIKLISWSLSLVLLILTSSLIYFTIYIPDSPTGKDFIAFWSAAKLSTLGLPELAYDFSSMENIIASASTLKNGFVWLYPPTYQAVLYPIGLVPYKSAFFIFIGTTTLAFIISLIILSKKNYRIIILSAPTIFIAIIFGQNSLLTATLGLISIALIRTHPFFSGVSMGLLSIKPHLFFCIPLFALIEKRWKALAWAVITSASLIIYSILLLGLKPWASFFENIKKSPLWLQDGTLPLNLMTSLTANTLLFGMSLTLSYTIHILSLALLLTIAILILKKTEDINLRATTLILVIINASPYFYIYELTWLTVALVFMLKDREWSIREYFFIGLSWVYPLFEFIADNIFEKSFSGTFLVSHALALIIYLHLQKSKIEFILTTRASLI